MADIVLTATVTRTELGQGVLDLNDDVAYTLGRGLSPGGAAWEKTAVTSPYVHGRFVTNERMGAVEGGLEVYCLGSSSQEVEDNLATLLEAFTEQYEYVLRVVTNGVTHEWLCERADYEVGFITETIAARLLPVRLSFYRHPVPVSGAF